MEKSMPILNEKRNGETKAIFSSQISQYHAELQIYHTVIAEVIVDEFHTSIH